MLLALLLAAGVLAAVYLRGLARAVDEDTRRFESGAFPAESLRPAVPGAAAEGGTDGDGGATEGGSGGDGAAGVVGEDPAATATQGSSGGLLAVPTAPAPGQPTPDVLGPEPASADEAMDAEAVDVLLIGEDSGDLGRGDVGRSDTLMWVHVPGDRSDVQIMSVMRDLWVPVPGHGDDRVNTAFFRGQAPLAVATVENMFQARVDHVVSVDLAGFQGLVDALGGVAVDNPQAFHTDAMGGHDFAAGRVTLDGEAALAYSRERHAFSDGDFTRVENQQRVVKAIISKGLSLETLSSPTRIQDAIERFAPFLTLDDTLDSGTLASLAWSMRDVRGGDVHSSTVPTLGVGYTDDGKAVVWPDWARVRQIGEEIRTGTFDGAS